jgi:nucleotide-binding universal stress UspA family protein
MRHILTALDGSPLAETILPIVEAIARPTQARVILLHVTAVPRDARPGSDHPGISEAVREDQALAEQYLRTLRQRLAAAGIEASVAVTAGDPAAEIVRYAAQEGVDLLALATHGRSGLQRWAHGSVADAVLHATSTPLLLVRPDDGWVAAPRTLQRIAVPLDGSPEAETALTVAEPLALRCGVPVVLLRFVEPVVFGFGGDPTSLAYADFQGIFDSTIAAAREQLERTAAAVRQRGATVSAEVTLAQPGQGIASYVRDHPGTLVVLTTHGRSGWRRLVLGSVARRVVQTVAAPILVCPAPAASAAGRR